MDSLRTSVEEKTRAKVWMNVGEKAYNKIFFEVAQNLRYKILANVWDKVETKVAKKIFVKVKENIEP